MCTTYVIEQQPIYKIIRCTMMQHHCVVSKHQRAIIRYKLFNCSGVAHLHCINVQYPYNSTPMDRTSAASSSASLHSSQSRNAKLIGRTNVQLAAKIDIRKIGSTSFSVATSWRSSSASWQLFAAQIGTANQ